MKINRTAKLVIALAIAFLLIIPGVILYGVISRSRLLDHHNVVAGEITGCKQGVKGAPKACNVMYSFVIDGKRYEGTTLFKSSQLDFDTCLAYLAGRSFPIVYETGNAENSELLLLSTRSARLYNYSFPDSLKWVEQYVHDN